ncbi:IS110 family transposase [Bacillus cereus]|uniref:IS110 family transposase n=1 Tax=Bacillus cereus TaxID=1396 RepID=UPI0009684C5D|nr:hypothetical protein BLD50_00420 [Bacillus cereus]
MYYIGIDIAKFKHYTSIIDQTGKTLTKPISFQNHTEGGNKLLDWIYRYISLATDALIIME